MLKIIQALCAVVLGLGVTILFITFIFWPAAAVEFLNINSDWCIAACGAWWIFIFMTCVAWGTLDDWVRERRAYKTAIERKRNPYGFHRKEAHD